MNDLVQSQKTLENYLELFFLYLEDAKNASPKTLENYSLRLGRFLQSVGSIAPHELTSLDVLQFRMELKKMNLSVATINYHIVAIRSFLKFLLRNDIDTLAPEKCDLAKTDPRQVSYLTDKELETFLNTPYEFEEPGLIQYRNAAILEVLFSTWLRVSELTNLKKNQLRDDSNQISVIGKWRKLRSVFMTDEAQEKLELYLLERDDESDFVFVSHTKNRPPDGLSRNAVEDLVRKYRHLCGFNKKITPHTIRHSFATQLLKRWADIRSVQALLGHSSITTTQIYTHVDDQYLAEVHKKLED